MKNSVLFLFSVFWLAGCANRPPFEPIQFTSVAEIEPRKAVEAFEAHLLKSFDVVESAVLTYRGREFMVLGYSSIDEAAEKIAVAGFSPTGAKLFELKKSGKMTQYVFNFPPDPQADAYEMANGMLTDIENIYLNRVPEMDSEMTKKKDRILFRQPSEGGTLEFVFGGPEEALVQKRFYKKGKELWRVRYHDYLWKDSKLFPSQVYFENYQRKYSVALRLKDVLS